MIKKGGIYTTEFSEFTYGYALTRDIERMYPGAVQSVPYFPSLREEGGPGSGYDVRIEWPIKPILLQFKLPRYLKRINSNSKEVDKVSAPGFRMLLHKRNESDQHANLVANDDGTKMVAYATPCFTWLSELNQLYGSAPGAVVKKTFFVRPKSISVTDDEEHYVAYNAAKTQVCFCSEPTEIKEEVSFASEIEECLHREPQSRTEFFSQLILSMLSGVKSRSASAPHEILTGGGTLEAQAAYVARTYLECQLLVVQQNRASS